MYAYTHIWRDTHIHMHIYIYIHMWREMGYETSTLRGSALVREILAPNFGNKSHILPS